MILGASKNSFHWTNTSSFLGILVNLAQRLKDPWIWTSRPWSNGFREVCPGYYHLYDVLIAPGLAATEEAIGPAIEIPDDYRGIPFSTWLDIFLEYALCLAKNGNAREAYNLCEAAKDAIVFYHSREDMFLIHVCWCGMLEIAIG